MELYEDAPNVGLKLTRLEVTATHVLVHQAASDNIQALSPSVRVFFPRYTLAEGTHCFSAFSHTPRLNIFAPEKGCGKTTLRDVVGCFVPKPIPAENFSAAVLFRLTAEHKPTILADEYDTWLRDNEELRGLLNAGHGRGGCAYRCEGDNHEVRKFEVFSPAVLAGIGNLPGTLADRSIQIRLERAKPGELSRRFDSRRTSAEQDLCRMLARFTTDEFSKIEQCEPDLPSGAVNRMADNWRPLFAIATVAGGGWLERVRAAFTRLTLGAGQESEGIGTTLLGDIQAVFTTLGTDRIFSADLTAALVAMEGRPWAEFGSSGKAITTNKLATQLKRFKITPRDVRIGNDKCKGYFRSDFEDSFARYVPSGVSGRDIETTLANIDQGALSESRQTKSMSRSANSLPINKNGPCLGVSDRKPGETPLAHPPVPNLSGEPVSSTQEVMRI